MCLFLNWKHIFSVEQHDRINKNIYVLNSSSYIEISWSKCWGKGYWKQDLDKRGQQMLKIKH